MGAFWLTRSELFGTTVELAGYKTGLVFTYAEIEDLLPSEYKHTWNGDPGELLRIRSEEYEDFFSMILYVLGSINTPRNAPPTTTMYHRYKNHPEALQIISDIATSWINDINKLKQSGQMKPGSSYDPIPLGKLMKSKYGFIGWTLTLEFMTLLSDHLHRSPWGTIRRVEWTDEIALNDLFRTRGIEASHGTFFDQRYIDYLSQNFKQLGSINWRRFEALTCEFFKRNGFRVEIGPGSNDDGVDARVWADDHSSPLLIVQCKRQKSKVGKVVVKSLYADVMHEKAQAGLIVTTSTLELGADATRRARGYPIHLADHKTLKKWIDAMRTPGTGIFLAE